jgi:hypothetical protein
MWSDLLAVTGSRREASLPVPPPSLTEDDQICLSQGHDLMANREEIEE